MKTLVSIQTEYLELINNYEQAEELTPELEQALTINEQELTEKARGYSEYIQNEDLFIKRIDDEIKRLQALKKSRQGKVSFLKDRLLEAVKMYGEINLGLSKIGTRKSTVVEVEDVNSLPQDYKVVKVTESADKVKIKEVLKEGGKVAGCKLVEKLHLKL